MGIVQRLACLSITTLTLARSARADGSGRPALLGEDERLTILDAGRACGRASLCAFAGEGTVLRPAPAPLLATLGHPLSVPPALPTFRRTGEHPTDEQTWNVELSATLPQPALAGNALFLVYDAEDASAVLHHEVTAMYQAPVRAGRSLAARLSFSVDEGFHAGHTYRVRVVQLVAGREVRLCETDLRLE